jgi:hypothetical protein
MHGFALGAAGFVNDAFEEAADSGVGKRAGIGALGIFQDFALAIGLIEREILRLLELADFKGAVRALVEEFDEFAVDFIDAAAPITQGHRVPRVARVAGVELWVALKPAPAWPAPAWMERREEMKQQPAGMPALPVRR